MEIVDIFSLPDGRIVYSISSNEVPEIHVGDYLVDCKGNEIRITGVGAATKCFGLRYAFSLLLDGEAEQGRIRLLPHEKV